MTDDEMLGAVLRRFLTSTSHEFFILGGGDHLTLDGKVEISDDECKAILRVTEGRIDVHGIAGQADPEFYELPPS